MTAIVRNSIIKSALTIGIALVWLVNGLYCKLLNFVPRHQLIVARILGEEHAVLITKTIGILEILMAVWVVSRIKSRRCALVQVIVIAIMNIIEFKLAPDLLLFGRVNAIVATFLIVIIITNEFIYNRSRDILHPIN